MPEFRIVRIGPNSPEALKRFVPMLFLDAGELAWRKYIEFFTAHIRNRNTREAYSRAIWQFARFCDRRKIHLLQLEPFHIALYIEQKMERLSRPSVKQHLAALRALFDFLVIGQALSRNPASSVRGPKYSLKRGKTPVLSAEEARHLIDSIDTTTPSGLRDRALIGVMVYSFARIGAVLDMDHEDYYRQGKRRWFRLHEKGGKLHALPAHREAEKYLDAFLLICGRSQIKGIPLFTTINCRGMFTSKRLSRREALAMIKRRAKRAGLPPTLCCHSFRATGITTYLLNGGTLEKAQFIANHESPRTTKLYDRTSDQMSLDEIERIVI